MNLKNPFSGREKTAHYQRVEIAMIYAGQVPEGGYDRPRILTDTERILRAKLIFEECLETINELGVDIVLRPRDSAAVSLNEAAKAAVVPHEFCLAEPWNMFIHMAGFADGIADISVVAIGSLVQAGITDEGLLFEVDSANLRKFPGGKPYAIRADGKYLKPPGWQLPDIQGVLADQTPA